MTAPVAIKHHFDGVAFPAARVVEGSRQPLHDLKNAVWTPGGATFVRLTTTVASKGRRWSTTSPLAFWRTFAVDLDLEKDTDIEGMVGRYGEPSGMLRPGTVVHTAHWPTLRAILRPLAAVWSDNPADPHAISTVDPARHALGGEFVHQLTGQFMKAITTEPDAESGIAFRYGNLGDFMIGSALEHWRQRTRMRRCQVCSHFFAIMRSTATTCSATCHSRQYLAERANKAMTELTQKRTSR